NFSRLCDNAHVGAHLAERFLHAPQVARAVINESNHSQSVRGAASPSMAWSIEPRPWEYGDFLGGNRAVNAGYHFVRPGLASEAGNVYPWVAWIFHTAAEPQASAPSPPCNGEEGRGEEVSWSLRTGIAPLLD